MANPLKKNKSHSSQVLAIVDELPEYQIQPMHKIKIVKEGIPKKALELLKDKARLDYNQLARVLDVSRQTLTNKKANGKFNQEVSNKILALADIYSYGYDVFQDTERFNRWIFSENSALGGRVPFEILTTYYGRLSVNNIIGRIEHGVYS
jgi:putative toxin-antitoxin system antitoxin component (TIGR02293 family)